MEVHHERGVKEYDYLYCQMGDHRLNRIFILKDVMPMQKSQKRAQPKRELKPQYLKFIMFQINRREDFLLFRKALEASGLDKDDLLGAACEALIEKIERQKREAEEEARRKEEERIGKEKEKARGKEFNRILRGIMKQLKEGEEE